MAHTLESYHTLDPAQPSGLGAAGAERAQDLLISFKAAVKLFSAPSPPVQPNDRSLIDQAKRF
jgi:hypothetical protein